MHYLNIWLRGWSEAVGVSYFLLLKQYFLNVILPLTLQSSFCFKVPLPLPVFNFFKVRESFANNVFDDCRPMRSKLTWLVLGGDPAARSHRVEQLTAL